MNTVSLDTTVKVHSGSLHSHRQFFLCSVHSNLVSSFRLQNGLSHSRPPSSNQCGVCILSMCFSKSYWSLHFSLHIGQTKVAVLRFFRVPVWVDTVAEGRESGTRWNALFDGRLRKLLPLNSLMVPEAAPSGLKKEATERLGGWEGRSLAGSFAEVWSKVQSVGEDFVWWLEDPDGGDEGEGEAGDWSMRMPEVLGRGSKPNDAALSEGVDSVEVGMKSLPLIISTVRITSSSNNWGVVFVRPFSDGLCLFFSQFAPKIILQIKLGAYLPGSSIFSIFIR